MKHTLNKYIEINAPKHSVWEVLVAPEHFAKWSREFCPDSRMQADLRVGGAIRYLDAQGKGLRARVVELEPDSLLTVEHECELKNGADDPAGTDWKGCRETYRLTEEAGVTRFSLTSEAPTKEFHDEFDKAWDRALQRIKELAEAPVPARSGG
ncbi:MAG: SRPBCC domain-containing protein [Elusimicrobia bacterium]|nr:SRPBCC domain-containing protein [Elusimicrobiota bacterium]